MESTAEFKELEKSLAGRSTLMTFDKRHNRPCEVCEKPLPTHVWAIIDDAGTVTACDISVGYLLFEKYRQISGA